MTTLPIEPLTIQEAQALIDAITGNGPVAVRNRALVAVLWRSGLRAAEIVALKPADVNLDTGEINVRRGKGAKQRVAVCDGLALAHVRAWLQVRAGLGLNGRQPLFCSVSRQKSETASVRRTVGKPLATAYVRRLLPQLAERAGIDKRVHPHGLRHTHTREMVEKGVPMNAIQAQLGHASIATTNHYTGKVAPTELLRVMRERGFALDQADNP